MNAHDDHRPRDATYKHSYYYTEMTAIKDWKKIDLTYKTERSKNETTK